LLHVASVLPDMMNLFSFCIPWLLFCKFEPIGRCQCLSSLNSEIILKEESLK
jgi:hypothetical protein